MALDKRSVKVLASVSPVLAAKIRAASDALNAKGTFLCVVSGLRTAQEQNDLYAQGRTTPGHKVTNAKAGFSMHNYGLAVDVVPYLSGEGGNLNWKEETPQFQAMIKVLKAQGLVWGGDWVSFHDGDHFQLPGVPDSPTAAMRKDYGGGNPTSLSAIWTKVADGTYAA